MGKNLGAHLLHSNILIGFAQIGLGQSAGDIIITEFMADPDCVSDTQGEYFELYNTTGATINIDGWTVKDDGTNSHIIANGGSLNVPAGGFLVLAIADNDNTNTDYVYTSFSLGNSGDEIVLLSDNTEITRLNYTNSSAGVAKELDNTQNHTSGLMNEANFNAATDVITTGCADLGSPGFAGNTVVVTGPEVDWCNLQLPESGNIINGNNFDVYARVYELGVTDAVGEGADVDAWIGYSLSNTDPSVGDWTWVPAIYNGDTDGDSNDEYTAEIGSGLTAGTYYYASRFQITDGYYKYGGYNVAGGGFWDEHTNVSGTLFVDVMSVSKLNEQSVSVYPNPTDGIFIIQTKFDNTNGIVSISNIEGKVLIQKTIESDVFEIDLSDYTSGVYLIEITINNTVVRKRIIKK